MLQVFLSLVMACVLVVANPVTAKELKPASKPVAQVSQKATQKKSIVQGKNIRINQASKEEIAKLFKGVGLAKAEAIVQFRKLNGPFKSAEELTQVKGIGQKTVARNKSILVFD